MADTTTDSTEAETFTTDEQGVAYTSETSPAADLGRPATIAPAAATGRRKEAVARVRIVPGSKQTSLVWTRMNTVTQGERMPPLSTHVIDARGLALIGEWIDAGAN